MSRQQKRNPMLQRPASQPSQTRDRLEVFTRGAISADTVSSPLADNAERLVTAHRKRVATREASARYHEERAGMNALMPEVIARKLKEAKSEVLLGSNRTPMILLADAHTCLSDALKQHPHDQGVRMARAYVYHKWASDHSGSMTIKDVYYIRSHFMDQFPKSKLASVVEHDFTKVGFNTLNVKEIFRLASQVHDQPSYEIIVQANGLDGNEPNKIRARALLRGLAELNVEEAPVRSGVPTTDGEGVWNRAVARLQAGDDPTVNKLSQHDAFDGPLMGDPPVPPGADPLSEDVMDTEEEIPHEEVSEGISEIESPYTGEDLVIELGQATEEEMPGATEEEMSMAPPMEPAGPMMSLGQLDELTMDEEELPGMPGETEEMPGEMDSEPTFTTMTDPSSGQDVEVTLTPIEVPEEDMGGMEPEMEMEPGMGSEIEGGIEVEGSPRTRQKRLLKKIRKMLRHRGHTASKVETRTYNVWVVNDGVRANESLDSFKASNLPAALVRVATMATEAEVRGEVFANSREAIVMLDSVNGNYLHVVAEGPETGKEFYPKVEQQQTDQMSVPEGGAVLTEEQQLKQLRPKLKVPHISKDAAIKILAKKGLTPQSVENTIFDGKIVTAAGWNLKLSDDLEITLWKNGAKSGKAASMQHLDRIIGDWTMYAARSLVAEDTDLLDELEDMVKEEEGSEDHTAAKEATIKLKATFVPVFSIECPNCKTANTYSYPKEASDLGCGCGQVVKIAQIEEYFECMAKEAQQYQEFIVHTDVPAGMDKAETKMNAKRMVNQIGKLVPHTDMRNLEVGEAGPGQMELYMRGLVDEDMMRKVEKVLKDKFNITQFESTRYADDEGESSDDGEYTEEMSSEADHDGEGEERGEGYTEEGGKEEGDYEHAMDKESDDVPPPTAPMLTPPTMASKTAQPQHDPGQAWSPSSEVDKPGIESKPETTEVTTVETETETQPQTPQVTASLFEVSYIDNNQPKKIKVLANSQFEARRLFRRHLKSDITKIAQLTPEMPGEMPAMPGEMPGAMPGDMSTPVPEVPEELLQTERPVGPEEAESIKAALLHYRHEGYGPAEAISQFMKDYEEENYEQAAIIKLTGEVYSKSEAVASRQAADKPKGTETPTKPTLGGPLTTGGPKVNTQQPDVVSVGKDLDEDSETKSEIKTPKKINQQNKSQPGTSDSVTPDNLGADSETKADISSPGKINQQHKPSQPGTSSSVAPDNLGKDMQGENAATKDMGSVSKKAPDSFLSKTSPGNAA